MRIWTLGQTNVVLGDVVRVMGSEVWLKKKSETVMFFTLKFQEITKASSCHFCEIPLAPQSGIPNYVKIRFEPILNFGCLQASLVFDSKQPDRIFP